MKSLSLPPRADDLRRRLAGWFACLLAGWLLLQGSDAGACMNAVIAEREEAVAQLREAEAALAADDPSEALRLANAAIEKLSATGLSGNVNLTARGQWVKALAVTRLGFADEHASALAAMGRSGAGSQKLPPAMEADYAEVLAASPEGEGRAFDLLKPLADKDLLGSAHAYAALARLARQRGEADLAAVALQRCETMAAQPRICRGERPRAPLLRGKPWGYAAPALVLLALLAWRKKTKALPWRGHRSRLSAGIVGAAIAVVFVFARQPWLTTALVGLAAIAVLTLERRGFLAAVRKGRIEGLVLRAVEPSDPSTPTVQLFFAPRGGELLERIPSPAYRTGARTAVLRLMPRPTGPYVLAGAVMIVIPVVLLAALATTLRSRPAMVEAEGFPPLSMDVPAKSAD